MVYGAGASEDTVPERDLDAIFKSGATSILSLFSPDPFSPFLPLRRLSSSMLRTPVIVSTALNRPRGLTLTRDHPLVRRKLPRASRRYFLNFLSARRMGNFGEGGFLERHERRGNSSVLKVTVDRCVNVLFDCRGSKGCSNAVSLRVACRPNLVSLSRIVFCGPCNVSMIENAADELRTVQVTLRR